MLGVATEAAFEAGTCAAEVVVVVVADSRSPSPSPPSPLNVNVDGDELGLICGKSRMSRTEKLEVRGILISSSLLIIKSNLSIKSTLINDRVYR